MAIHTAPATCSRAGEKIVTSFNGPISFRSFDWSAWFDNDEPDDDGNILQGSGSTERDAIDDLLTELAARE